MQQKEHGKGAREGKGTLKKMKDMRQEIYGKKKTFIRDGMHT